MGTIGGGDPRAPRRRDAALTLALIALTVAEGMARRDLAWPWITVATTVVLLAGLPWRRRHPLALVLVMTVVTTGSAAAQAIAGVAQSGLAVMLALLLVPYSLYRWGNPFERVVGSIALALGVLVSAALSSAPVADRVIGAIVGVLLVGTVCLAGALRRERAASLEREIAMARAQERTALARDLHDTVAHHVSTIAIRAQAANARHPFSGELTEAFAVVEREATAALSEMRAIVGTLREPAEYTPSRGLDDLAALAAAGPPRVVVRIDTMGELPQLVALTLHRVAQEAVTNARRHAVGARLIGVDVRADADDVVLTVVDDGRPPTVPGSGYGLRGIAERVALLGGELDAGPGRDGGWSLRVRIPRRSA